jgi:glycosyltransferase involved in cell wall biosynthesis
LERARLISDEIFVVDSYSNDNTVQLACDGKAHVVQHIFKHYGAQRNWAIDNLPITRPWQLHLDADEWMDDKLIATINELPDNLEYNGYLLSRYLRYMGRILRHGGMSPTWHLRLFRTGLGYCEDRKYDQHFLLKRGACKQLPGAMIDNVRMSLSEWTKRHNQWADNETAEYYTTEHTWCVHPDFYGDAIQRKRYLHKQYDRLPLFVRPFMLFIYRYLFRLGFLDGTEGLIFWILQTFWFRFLVDAKIWEMRHVTDISITKSGSDTST